MRGSLDSLSMIREILATMLAGHRGKRRKVFHSPCLPLGADGSLTYHEATLLADPYRFELRTGQYQRRAGHRL